jgi:two-component system chemotaxis response regulator CheB
MANRDIVVIGASAGGVDALQRLIAQLPGDLRASIFIVLHISPHLPSYLPQILRNTGKLPADHPSNGLEIQQGRIYVAPPDHHMLLHSDGIRVIRGAKENRHRPAIDPLFRSAAVSYGPRVIGILLTGNLDDGTAGFIAIKRAGGVLMIQSPEDAQYPEMPLNAARALDVDHILPLSELAEQLINIINEQMPDKPKSSEDPNAKFETNITEFDLDAISNEKRNGEPSAYACPDCKGVLFEINDGELVRFRCRVGHGFSRESLAIEQGEVIEQALWTALTTLEERASFLRKMARESRAKEQLINLKIYEKRIQDVEEKATAIRKILLDSDHYSGLRPTEKELDGQKA